MSGSSGRGIGAVDLLLDGFAGYLRSERGVTELTVDVYVADVRRFLVDRGGDCSDLPPVDSPATHTNPRSGRNNDDVGSIGDLKLFEPKTTCPFIAVRDCGER